MDKPWVTADIKGAIKRRQRGWVNGNFSNYTFYRRKVSKLCNRARRSFYSSIVKQSKSVTLGNGGIILSVIVKQSKSVTLGNGGIILSVSLVCLMNNNSLVSIVTTRSVKTSNHLSTSPNCSVMLLKTSRH